MRSWTTAKVRPAPKNLSGQALCYEDPTEACLRRTWVNSLAALHREELHAPRGGRSYRLVWERSFHPHVTIQIDLPRAGDGVLTMTWLGLDTPFGSVGPLPVPRSEVENVEAAMAANRFDWIIADEKDIPTGVSPLRPCADGAEWTVEATGPRGYRYVTRACHQAGGVVAIGVAMIDLARSRTGSKILDPVY